MIPAQVFLSSVVGVEFMASAVTSPMESQHVDEIPKWSLSISRYQNVKQTLTRDSGIQNVSECNDTIGEEKGDGNFW